MTIPNAGEALQPFCGALTKISTPHFCISTHIAPDAIQSNTNMPPTEWTASETAFIYSSGRMMPADVSTWGAKTIAGFSDLIFWTTSLSQKDQ